MSDGVIIVVGLLLIALVPADLYAAIRLVSEAAKPPPIPTLRLYALGSTGVAISSVTSGVLAVATIYRVATGEPFLPNGVGLTLLLLGMFIISIPNLFLIRQLRRWDRA